MVNRDVVKWSSMLRPGMHYPDHVNYFAPTTLAQMLKNAGHWRVYMPLRWRLPTSDNLWAVACAEMTPTDRPWRKWPACPINFRQGVKRMVQRVSRGGPLPGSDSVPKAG